MSYHGPLTGPLFMTAFAAWTAIAAGGETRIEHFDRDPHWEGINNRTQNPACVITRQDFGYSGNSDHCGRGAGEIGGLIQSAAEPAWYAKVIPRASFEDELTARGTIRLSEPINDAHFLLGFFNSKTARGWRTPNSITLRFRGRGTDDRVPIFITFADYMSNKWRAGGLAVGGISASTGREKPLPFETGETVHTWSLHYDPQADAGRGVLSGAIDGQVVRIPVVPGHRQDGATFDRFGLLTLMKYAAAPTSVWIDDVEINGMHEDFAEDPGWEGRGNRRTYRDCAVRPRFNFGYSPTNHAGGQQPGELGGLVFRGDCRFPERMASYGARVGGLNMGQQLRAGGKVCLRRGITDSTVLIGFYHSKESMRSNPSQASGWPANFLGVVVEGPSAEGFLFYPSYRTNQDETGGGYSSGSPHILPDGSAHDWSLDFEPRASGEPGRLSLIFDGQSQTIDLPASHCSDRTQFDRFGIVTTWIDGNSQEIYFDDLSYTSAK